MVLGEGLDSDSLEWAESVLDSLLDSPEPLDSPLDPIGSLLRFEHLHFVEGLVRCTRNLGFFEVLFFLASRAIISDSVSSTV